MLGLQHSIMPMGIEQVWATASGHKSDIIKSFGGIPIDRHNEDFTQIGKKELMEEELTIY